MVEILTKVFGGLFGSSALLFVGFALFIPGHSFLHEFEKNEEKKKAAAKKLTIQTVILGSIVIILGVIALVLAILSR